MLPPSPPPSPTAFLYILGILFLLPPPAPFLSLYTEKVIVALAFPRLPLLYTRPDNDFLDDNDDDDDFALFEITAVSLPSSSMSISRLVKNACKSLYSVKGLEVIGVGVGKEGEKACKKAELSFTCSWFRNIITLFSSLLDYFFLTFIYLF